MAVWPFNRKQKNKAPVPPEVKRYYDSEHRERVGLAWLVAFLSLIATILIVAGLFFGGRWIYRKLTHKNNQPSTSQPASTNQSESANNQSESQSSQSQTDNSSSSSSESNSSSSSNNSEPTTNTPSSQAPSNQVANTGPGSNLAIFLAVTIIATAGHSIYLRRRLAK